MSMQIQVNTPNTRLQAEILPKTKPIQIKVFCELCPERAEDIKENLQRAGWGVYQKHCFCPEHEEMI